jgi:hypothetical protein
MKSITTHIAGWLIVGLTVLPLMAADAGQQEAAEERLAWLLTTHDVRHVMQAPRAPADCAHGRGESDR